MNQYDKIGKKYLEGQKTHFSKIYDESTDFIVDKIKKTNFRNKRILDVGCGDGQHMRLLEKLGAKKVYGLEPSRVMISQAKQLGSKSKRLILGTLQRNKLQSNFFDIIYARFSIHHDRAIAPIYQAVYRLLKPGGTLIITIPHPIRVAFLLKSGVYRSGMRLVTHLFKSRVPIVSHVHTFSEYISKHLLRKFDLKEIVEEKRPHIQIGKIKIPEFMGIVATKKR